MSLPEFNHNIRLKKGKKLTAENAAQTAYNDLVGLDSGDNIRLPSRPIYTRHSFSNLPDPIIAKSRGAGAATGTAGDVNIISFPALQLNYVVKGTQTIVAPIMTTVGLDIGSQDQTAADGVEYRPSILSSHPYKFTVGTSGAFYAEYRFKLEDVSGASDFGMGFRKYEADQANIDDYNDAAYLNSNNGTINIETILANAATVTTNTTQAWLDGETHTFTVKVSAAGVVTYLIDGAPPTVTAAYTFANGAVVIPFVFFLQDTDIAGKVEWIYFECGLQS